MKEAILSWKKEPRDKKVQYCCVLVLLLVELMFFSPPMHAAGAAMLSVDYFMVIPAGLFLLITLRKGINRKGRATLVLGLLMAAWAVAVEVLRFRFNMDFFAPGGIAMYYGLALPMAFAIEDEHRQWGITAFALLFVLAGIRLCIQAAGLILGILPESYSAFVRWDGARLQQMFHPTNCALILMLGIGFSLALCFRTKRNWLRAVLIVLAMLQFGVQCLTNGRNAAGFTSLMVGGFLFCLLRGTGWKRIPVALVAGVALAGMLFITSQRMYAAHEQRMYDAASLQQPQTTQTEQADVAEQMQQTEASYEPLQQIRVIPMVQIDFPEQVQMPEVSYEVETNNRSGQSKKNWEQAGVLLSQIDYPAVLPRENAQGTLREDLVTFNGRSSIWVEAVNGALRHPLILLCGTDSMVEVLGEGGEINAEHTHSSYLDTLYTLGIPGLLLSLAITLLVLRAGVLVLWRNTDLWKSCVAVLTLCTLGSSILEPYLFAAKNYHHYICVLFLIAAGYLHRWSLDK